jgi:hypothetical protein
LWHGIRDGAWRLELEDATDAALRSRGWGFGLLALSIAGLVAALAWGYRRKRGGAD